MNQQIPEFGWWIKIFTNNPMCIYYFGAFDSYYEAVRHKSGYIQDLSQEGSFISDIQISKCQPQQLTIDLEPKRVLLPLPSAVENKTVSLSYELGKVRRNREMNLA